MDGTEPVIDAGYDIGDGRLVNPEGVEVNVALQCNLTCRACTHLSPVLPRSLIDPDRVHADLSALATAYRCAFVKLLGGEPLLHRDLPAVIDAARASGVSDHILVCTNGLLLDRMGEAFWSRVDEVEISAYPGRKPSAESLARASERAREHGVRLHLNAYSHFRESYSEVGTHDPELVSALFRTCKMAHVWRCHTVHDGHFYRCPSSLFLPMVLGPADELYADAIHLQPGEGLFERLRHYLTDTRPLVACRHCLGSVGRRLAHTQIPRREWRQLQTAPSEALLDQGFLAVLQEDPDADDGCVSRRQVLAEGR